MTMTRKFTRTFMVVAGVLALLAAVAACGSDSDDSSSAAATDENATDEAAPSTRTVEHALGTTEVPLDPERVIVVDRRGSLAFLLELGVEPVAALEAEWLFGEPFHPLIADAAADAGVEPITGTDGGPNVEEIAQLDPDLIIGNVRDMGETADALAGIAPTVGLEWNFADPAANATMLGEILGLEDEAAALIEDYETAFDDAIATTEDPGTVSIVGLFSPEDMRIYREGNLYGSMTTALGGELVPSEEELPLDPEDGEVNFVSLEQIGLASGDTLISLVNLAPSEDGNGYEAVERESLVQALPGFQNDRVLEADPQLAFGAAGIGGLKEMLDQLVVFYNS
jgi:iron complex transport system substrate-binding protein